MLYNKWLKFEINLLPWSRGSQEDYIRAFGSGPLCVVWGGGQVLWIFKFLISMVGETTSQPTSFQVIRSASMRKWESDLVLAVNMGKTSDFISIFFHSLIQQIFIEHLRCDSNILGTRNRKINWREEEHELGEVTVYFYILRIRRI